MDFSLAQVSRQPPPPLPGGYTVGEQVYFTGTSQTFENGDRLVHGKQGEVAGPTTSPCLPCSTRSPSPKVLPAPVK